MSSRPLPRSAAESHRAGATPPRAVRVWDLPTRLFHWTLALAIVGSVVTAKVGGNAAVWHFRLGFLVLGLLAFRLLWGLVGGYWSRFVRFVPTPGRLVRYLRSAPRADDHFDVGHNPLGALSVLGMLGLLAVQVATGLVADDEIANAGPLVRFVASETSLAATSWHKTWGQWLILGLVALHVAAIVFYRVAKGNNLVAPMLGGDKLLAPGVPGSADGLRERGLAIVLAALCGAGVAWVVSLAVV
jgi:cytochrome b